MDPLISVIIPVHNVNKYLKEALDSVINQTYKNLEIIIIDDGSTDGSEVICDEYKEDFRTKVIHQKNKGLSAARNIGLEIAKGEYIAFLDSDDAFRPNMLSTMICANEKIDADIIVCGYDTYHTEGNMGCNLKKMRKGVHYKQDILTGTKAQSMLLTGEMNCSVWNKLFKKSLWNDISFPVGHVYEDVHVILKLFEKSKYVLTIPQVFVIYRRRIGSITTSEAIEHIKDYILAYRIVDDYIDLHTPAVFSYEEVNSYRARIARELSFKYAELHFGKHLNKEASIINREVSKLFDNLNLKKSEIKTQFVYVLFKYAPFLLLPLRVCWDVRTDNPCKWHINNHKLAYEYSEKHNF